MQSNNQQRFSRMAAFSVAAFILCFALAGSSHTAAGFSDKKAYNKGYRALRRGDFEAAERIFRDLLNKDAHDTEARIASQLSDSERLKYAHVVIRNDGSREDLKKQLSTAWERLAR